MTEFTLAKIWRIWLEGGWTMIPLLAVSLVIYGLAVRLLLYFKHVGYASAAADGKWLEWIRHPEKGEGEIGEIIRYTQDNARTVDEIQNRFSEVVSSKLPDIDRRLAFLNVLVAAAPLLGLLGTVLGMLATFQALSTGGGKAVGMIASGISEALITTEMGLLIALPGLVFAFMIRRKRNEYEAFLARLESMTVQSRRKTLPSNRQGPPASAAARPDDLELGSLSPAAT